MKKIFAILFVLFFSLCCFAEGAEISINDINYSYVEKETLDILIDFERE